VLAEWKSFENVKIINYFNEVKGESNRVQLVTLSRCSCVLLLTSSRKGKWTRVKFYDVVQVPGLLVTGQDVLEALSSLSHFRNSTRWRDCVVL